MTPDARADHREADDRGLKARGRAAYKHLFLDHPDGPVGAWVSFCGLLLLAGAIAHFVVRRL